MEKIIQRLSNAIGNENYDVFKQICSSFDGNVLDLILRPDDQLCSGSLAAEMFLTKNLKMVEYLIHVLQMDVEQLIQRRKSQVENFKQNYFIYATASPLWVACINGHLNVVRFLISSGANPNAIGKPKYFYPDGILDKSTPLHIAVNQGHREVVEFLVREGRADLGAVTGSGYTCLMIACLRKNIEEIKLLIQLGADVNQTNSSGETVLHKLVRIPDQNCFPNILKLFLDHGIRFRKDLEGRSPIMLAAANHNQTIFKYLLEEHSEQFERDDIATANQISFDYLELKSKIMNYQHDRCFDEGDALENCNSIVIAIIEKCYSSKFPLMSFCDLIDSFPRTFFRCRLRLIMSILEKTSDITAPLDKLTLRLLCKIIDYLSNPRITSTRNSRFQSFILQCFHLTIVEIERGVDYIDQLGDYKLVKDIAKSKTEHFFNKATFLAYNINKISHFSSNFNEEQKLVLEKLLRRLVQLDERNCGIELNILFIILKSKTVKISRLKKLFLWLLQSGADGSAADSQRETILHRLVYNYVNYNTSRNEAEFVTLVRLILESTGEQLLNRANRKGVTPAKMIERVDNINLVQDLLNPLRFGSLQRLSARAIRRHWTYENIKRLPKILSDQVLLLSEKHLKSIFKPLV